MSKHLKLISVSIAVVIMLTIKVHAARGTWENPKNWSEKTNIGDIHKALIGDETVYFESRFNGSASETNKYYYPESKTSNEYWRYISPVEYIAFIADPQYPRFKDNYNKPTESKAAIKEQYNAIANFQMKKGNSF
ncbi:hypothetical protein [Pleionea sp. CnH1-48]|uniref:hypothetical protein n=1 Tax=Pleionea sp. CnH1-48 TaxID=2954494 RepID=UPI0020981697|nr:hypothetical protein [Pleionea sp. CnH1-48]MCO7227556.1 hypothetical protein [Pleionea sp. CnH1-48]